MEIIISFIQRAILQGTPLLFGATGEILTEKSGNLNLGIPGIMYIGAISGVIGGFFYQTNAAAINPFLAILIPLLCCLLGALLDAVTADPSLNDEATLMALARSIYEKNTERKDI